MTPASHCSQVSSSSAPSLSRRAGIASGSGGHTRTDVHLHLDVSPPELTAHADPERIHQVVANLIDNAVKHSPPHGRVTVKARRGERPQSLELEVLDEGPGIPRSQWHRVFERFNRGAVPSPHGPGSDGGTGLVLLHLCYLWKDPADPEDGFARFFEHEVVPVIEAAGLPVIGSFIPERSPNNFPRLPVREGEKVFVWMTRAADADDWALRWSACRHAPAWRALAPRWLDAQERAPQILRLRPSVGSALY